MSALDPDRLAMFTGTNHYHRLTRRYLLTDGTKHLSDTAGAYWLMDAIASHLDEIGVADWFVVVRITVKNTEALMVYEDGNGHEYARQAIPYTDFPMAEMTVFCSFDGEIWVLMLPNEY